MDLLNTKKQYGANKAIVNLVVGLVVGVILFVAVGIPIVTQTITSANLTGISATIVGFLPVFMALGALVLVATSIGTRA